MREMTMLVSERDAGRRADRLLRERFRMAEGYISALKFRDRGITLNGERIRSDVRVSAGDRLSARIDDERGENPAEPMDVPLCFVYEDEDLAVISKAAGMAVHGSLRGGEPTVANALAYCWGSDRSFHPVNRLDRGTSGLMVIAKSGYVHDRLRESLHREGFRREYLAVAEGRVEPPRASITLPIAAGEGTRRVISPNGQPSRTDYETLASDGERTLLRVLPKTGRTHQIRVHLAAIGHPLCGDSFYGAGESTPIRRPALHSARLLFTHPVSGETICLEAPLPEDMQRLADMIM